MYAHPIWKSLKTSDVLDNILIMLLIMSLQYYHKASITVGFFLKNFFLRFMPILNPRQ